MHITVAGGRMESAACDIIYAIRQRARCPSGLLTGFIHPYSGQEEYERLRPMSYSKSHVILIAFAIDTPDSLDNVTVKVREIVVRT